MGFYVFMLICGGFLYFFCYRTADLIQKINEGNSNTIKEYANKLCRSFIALVFCVLLASMAVSAKCDELVIDKINELTESVELLENPLDTEV